MQTVKKSIYLFLTAMLGMVLFMSLHRLAMFFLAFAFELYGSVPFFGSFFNFLAFDYFSLTIVLLAGIWYGIWLGEYWYNLVYIERGGAGAFSRLVSSVRVSKSADIKSRLAQVAGRLENDLAALEHLSARIEDRVHKPKPIKRRVVRKTSVKKSVKPFLP